MGVAEAGAQLHVGGGMPEHEKKSNLEYFYPEVGAGGFSHVSSSVDFYTRINALLQPEFVVMDFGAGRGRAAEEGNGYTQNLMKLQGKVRKVIGVDVDPAIHLNPWLDEARVIEPADPLPFDDGTFDMIVSDWTLEHIADVEPVTAELKRVLKPGGWLCARTPNRWGYIAIGARLIPRQFHSAVLNWAQAERKEIDVFPKYYLLNTKRNLLINFNYKYFNQYIYFVNSEPAYFGSSKALWSLALLAFRLTPDVLGAILHVFLRKKPVPTASCLEPGSR